MTVNPDGRPVIGLLPLDERPVNVGLVHDVARVAGVDLTTPPPGLLPTFRTPGDTNGLASWLVDTAREPRTQALVVSADMLAYGGLIPARTSSETPAAALARLDVLRTVRSVRPGLSISVVSLITRATDSYSNAEEPEYWSGYGRELHALGGNVHRAWRGAADAMTKVPGDIRLDFAARRLRNHLVNLASLGLRWEGIIDHLALTADDTAEYSAGSAEQELLRYWQLLQPTEGLGVHPGADETGAVLVARALVQLAGVRPTVAVVPGDPDGMALVPPYENQPLTQSIPRHVASAGGVVGDAGSVALVIHTPDQARGDHFDLVEPLSDPEAVRRTVRAVRTALDRFDLVALADLRYANGADPQLVESLAAEGLLWRLTAYSGWNTAGNAVGSAIALLLAAVAGRTLGTMDARASRTALARRLLDDYAYQSRVRREVAAELFGSTIAPVPQQTARMAADRIRERLDVYLERLGAPSDLRLETVELPWLRSFEVDLRLSTDQETI